MDTQPTNSTNHRDMNYIYKQFLHDIQAPVSAMHAILNCLDQAPEELVSCYQMALDRISEMLTDLKSHMTVGHSTEPLQRINVLPIIEQIIREKRLSENCPNGIKIALNSDLATHSGSALAQTSQFKRMISNLLNNAIEAVHPNHGEIQFDVLSAPSTLLIRILDNGCGIPAEMIDRVTDFHFTHGKPGGSGLGLFHAKSLIESWGGQLRITSEIGTGTHIEITLCAGSVTTHAQSPT